jgi:hypothetical protein
VDYETRIAPSFYVSYIQFLGMFRGSLVCSSLISIGQNPSLE